jgi:DNA-binding SARP family transcriptional activator/predicted ATPase
MPRLSMWFLGGHHVSLDQEPLRGLEYDKVRALLAYLAIEAGRPHRREALAGLLWPELPERRARRNLSQALFSLRNALATTEGTEPSSPYLTVNPQNIQFNRDSDHWLDVSSFLSLHAACHEHPHWRLETCPACIERLSEAIALYRGPLLEGLSIADSPAFEEWQLYHRERLHALASDALGALAVNAEAHGAYEEALAHAQRWLQLDPWHEGAHRALMRALALSGRRSAALTQYERCRLALREQLGVEPTRTTDALYRQIRDGEMPDPAIQPLQSNLPALSTPLIGRASELAQLTALLRKPTCRLVTIAGPGGVGKTHLALQFASDLAPQAPADRFADGICYLSLAAAPSSGALLSTLLDALDLAVQPGMTPRQQLLSYLRHRELLLLLDNFEHLITPSPSRQADGTMLVSQILQHAPGVSILVTSRVRLNLAGEHVLELGGLPYPRAPDQAAAEPGDFPAVQLFLQTAHRVRPDPELPGTELPHIARICCLLGGMPLAVVLAAAWCDVLSPAQIENRVRAGLRYLSADYRDLPPRQHSMRAVFDSAWALLAEVERAGFARLCLFRGPFTAKAAGAVASAGPGTLRALIHKSFLARNAGDRYTIHPLLRQYGQERLEERPAEAQDAAERHYRYYTAFMERNRDMVFYGDPRPAMSEMENIRAAWHWALAHDRVDALGMLTISLHALYAISQRSADGEADMARAAALLREGEAGGRRGIVLGIVLVSQGALAQATGKRQPAARLLGEGLLLLRRLEAGQELAWACYTAADQGSLHDYAAARALLLEALAISRRLSLAWEEAYTLVGLAALELRRGDYVEAERYRRQGLALSREHGFHRVTAYCLLGEGHMAYERGAYAEARPSLQAALALFRSVGSQGALCAQSLLGDVGLAEGAYGEAQGHYHAVLSTSRHLGAAWMEPLAGDCLGIGPTLNRLGDVALARGDVEQAAARYREALELAVREPHLGLKLDALAHQALWSARKDSPERAVVLGALVASHPACVKPTRKLVERLLFRLQGELSPEAYAAAIAQSQRVGVEEMLAACTIEGLDPGHERT